MAKQFTFTFSKEKSPVEFKDKKGKVFETKTAMELEIALLSNLFTIACDMQKNISKSFECKDCMDALSNLEDGKDINFTEGDVKYLVEAFEKTVDQRPPWWFGECSNILRQIDNPTEEDALLKENKSKKKTQ